jgi:hypothetical protein
LVFCTEKNLATLLLNAFQEAIFLAQPADPKNPVFNFFHSASKYFQAGISGADVTITIFGDFCQFSEQKMAFFSKTNGIINVLLVEQKRQYFSKIFRHEKQHRSQIFRPMADCLLWTST